MPTIEASTRLVTSTVVRPSFFIVSSLSRCRFDCSGNRSVVWVPCLGEEWCWVAAGLGGEQIGEVGEQGAFLESAGDRGGEQPFDGVLALFGLTAEREFAVDDGAAE